MIKSVTRSQSNRAVIQLLKTTVKAERPTNKQQLVKHVQGYQLLKQFPEKSTLHKMAVIPKNECHIVVKHLKDQSLHFNHVLYYSKSTVRPNDRNGPFLNSHHCSDRTLRQECSPLCTNHITPCFLELWQQTTKQISWLSFRWTLD